MEIYHTWSICVVFHQPKFPWYFLIRGAEVIACQLAWWHFGLCFKIRARGSGMRLCDVVSMFWVDFAAGFQTLIGKQMHIEIQIVWQKEYNYLKAQSNFLVAGFNPCEKYGRQIGIFPSKNSRNHHLAFCGLHCALGMLPLWASVWTNTTHSIGLRV